jgi:hypothetical protein
VVAECFNKQLSAPPAGDVIVSVSILHFPLTMSVRPVLAVHTSIARTPPERPTYEGILADQIQQAKQRQGEGDLEELLNRGDTWTVSKKELGN